MKHKILVTRIKCQVYYKMDEFCEDVIEHLRSEKDRYKVITLILRDVFLNELIYVSYNNAWKQYNFHTKTWSSFDANILIQRMHFVHKFLSSTLYNYVNEKHEFDLMQKSEILKTIYETCAYIDSVHEKDNEALIKHFSHFFYIGL
jgi:hypothetical protein